MHEPYLTKQSKEQPSSVHTTLVSEPALHGLTTQLNELQLVEITLEDSHPPSGSPGTSAADPSSLAVREELMPGSHTSSLQELKRRRMLFVKKPRLECLFCRRRKIACGPAKGSLDDDGSCRYVLRSSPITLFICATGRQCVHRLIKCEYPSILKKSLKSYQTSTVKKKLRLAKLQ